MSRTNESRSVKLHEACKCICRLNKIVCKNKLKWNKDKRRCECKILINKGVCNKGYIFHPSNCECECDKSCNSSQYLDSLDCKCKNKIIDLIVEKCTEYDNKTKIVNKTDNKTNNETNNKTDDKTDNKTIIVTKTVKKKL